MDYSVFERDEQLLMQAYREFSLPVEWESELKKGGWYRIFLPEQIGGLQFSLEEGLHVLIETAAIHGSLGWRINLGAGAGYFAGNMHPAVSSKVYGPADAVVSGSGAVGGEATLKDENWIVNGSWPFCTGALQATAFTFNARISTGEIRTFILQPSQVKILKEWKYFGLKATQTYTVQVYNAVVPKEMIFTVGNHVNFMEYPLYAMDFYQFARFCMASSYAGMALGVVHHAKRFFHESKSLGPAWQSAVKSLEKTTLELRQFLLSEAKRKYGTSYTDTQEKIFNQRLSSYKKDIENLSLHLFQHGGMDICNEQVLLHHALRDLWLAARHFLLKEGA